MNADGPNARKKLIDQYKDGYRVVAEAVAGATEEELDAPPAPGKWSAREIVHHLADSEMTRRCGCVLLLATDNPRIVGFDQDEFARRLHYDRPIEASLEPFKAARRSTAEMLDRMTRRRLDAAGHPHRARPYTPSSGGSKSTRAHAHKHAEQILAARDTARKQTDRVTNG